MSRFSASFSWGISSHPSAPRRALPELELTRIVPAPASTCPLIPLIPTAGTPSRVSHCVQTPSYIRTMPGGPNVQTRSALSTATATLRPGSITVRSQSNPAKPSVSAATSKVSICKNCGCGTAICSVRTKSTTGPAAEKSATESCWTRSAGGTERGEGPTALPLDRFRIPPLRRKSPAAADAKLGSAHISSAPPAKPE